MLYAFFSAGNALFYGENTPLYDFYNFRRVFIHPGFRPPDTYYDIAVIELSKRVNYNFSYNDLSDINRFTVSPECLPKDVLVHILSYFVKIMTTYNPCNLVAV